MVRRERLDNEEHVGVILRQAGTAGVNLCFDKGMIVATFSTAGDRETQFAVVRELGEYCPSVRKILVDRAIAERAKELVGRPVWCSEWGAGTLSGARENGLLVADMTLPPGRSAPQQISAGASIVILFDEAQPDEPSRLPEVLKSRRWALRFSWLGKLTARAAVLLVAVCDGARLRLPQQPGFDACPKLGVKNPYGLEPAGSGIGEGAPSTDA